MNPEFTSLTGIEREAMSSLHNLTEGHAKFRLTGPQLAVRDNLSEVFLQAEREPVGDIEKRFIKSFFEYAGQYSYVHLTEPSIHPTSSYALEVVASYLRLKGKSVALIEPTFDCIADILKVHKIPLEAVSEERIFDNPQKIGDIKSDALFLVVPNNPTGSEMTRSQFEDIVSWCKKNDKFLILDFSLRFYSSLTTWDQYDLLQTSGVDFICVEDTGKTWPTQEMKAGILTSSSNFYAELRQLSESLILTHSPFALLLLQAFIEAEPEKIVSAQHLVDINRSVLRDALSKISLISENPNERISVEWVRLPRAWSSPHFCAWLRQKDVYILPGGPFYWNELSKGDSFVRIALARPEEDFIRSIERLSELTNTYSQSLTV